MFITTKILGTGAVLAALGCGAMVGLPSESNRTVAALGKACAGDAAATAVTVSELSWSARPGQMRCESACSVPATLRSR